ncbi:MAG: hypothetical protein JWO87_1250 [Phycisphaerales bacterium]|nr:hypothetical protein [Phycisphaerales bacterium]
MPLRFVNPNLHVILIHYPLGVFVLGVFLELFSFLWKRSPVRTAARFMIVIGALLSLPSATSGIYALFDVRKNQGLDDARYHMLRLHVIYMGIASILAVTCAVVGLGASDAWRKKLHIPLLAGVVIAWGLMVFGAWHGGETIYQHGTSVAIIKVKEVEDADGNTAKKTVLVPLKEPESKDLKSYKPVVRYYIGGELQQHLVLSGFAFAAAFGALGLSIRRLTTAHAASADEAVELAARVASVGSDRPRRVTDDLSVIRSFNPDAEMDLDEDDDASVPSGRWWLLAVLLVITTAAAGYWTMSKSHFFTHEGWMNDFVDSLSGDKKWSINRHMAHLILGSALAVVGLIFAALALWAPRRPGLLTVFAALLVLIVAGQVWMGVLMTFDSEMEGPLTHFTREKTAAAPAMVDTATASAQGVSPSLAH